MKLKDYKNEIIKGDDGYSYSKNTKQKLNSPTYLLRPYTNLVLGMIPDHILEDARERGKDVGGAIEVYEEIGEVMLDNEANQPMIDAYLEWKDKHDIKVLATEYYVVDHVNSTHGYVDLIVEYKGKVCGIEIKTRKDTRLRDTDAIQNYIYQRPLGIPFYGLVLGINGDYKFEKFKFTKDIKNKLKTLIAFRGMLGKQRIKGD